MPPGRYPESWECRSSTAIFTVRPGAVSRQPGELRRTPCALAIEFRHDVAFLEAARDAGVSLRTS